MEFGGTVVGGLSGIDCAPQGNPCYLLSDDRSRFSDARFYLAQLGLTSSSFERVELQSVITLRMPDGKPFPAHPDTQAADPEAIRFDARSGMLWWTSEGNRSGGLMQGPRLVDPFVRIADPQGNFVSELQLPAMFRMSAGERGPRNNETFEGLSFAPDGKSVWVSMEGPLLQDGASANVRSGALIRISRLALEGRSGGRPDSEAGRLLAQYAYPVEPVPEAPLVPGAFADNGVSEILALSDIRILVLERAYAVGRGVTARLYEATTEGASDIRQFDSLAQANIQPMRKRLILDFASLQLAQLDNLEAMGWGPPLENGNRSLIFVSDDNFNPAQLTQFLAFEVLPMPQATMPAQP